MEVLVGIDAGTTSVKALLMTPDGRELAVGRAATTWRQTSTGADMSPDAITAAARSALADALSQQPDARVVGIGVASMAESGVLTDGDDHPLAPVIAWHDTRDVGELAELERDLGGEEFSRTTGLPVWTQWSLTKHRWLRRHVPATSRATRRYNIAEWIVRDLGGDPVSEPSLTSRTGWLTLSGERYDAALDWAGAAPGLVGPLVEAGTPIGRVSRSRTTASGPLAALDGAVLTVAGHDHQVAAVGLGSFHPGDEFDSAGTAEALMRTSAPELSADAVGELTRAGVTVGAHAAPGRWCLLGATQGGLILSRVLEQLGVGRDGMPALDRAALAAPDVPGSVTLGPGTADVSVDPDAEAAVVWRAATHAVTIQARELADRLEGVAGPRGDLVVAGGWTHSAALMAAKTQLLGAHRTSTVSEAGCRGAALFAGVAAGFYPELEAAPTPL